MHLIEKLDDDADDTAEEQMNQESLSKNPHPIHTVSVNVGMEKKEGNEEMECTSDEDNFLNNWKPHNMFFINHIPSSLPSGEGKDREELRHENKNGNENEEEKDFEILNIPPDTVYIQTERSILHHLPLILADSDAVISQYTSGHIDMNAALITHKQEALKEEFLNSTSDPVNSHIFSIKAKSSTKGNEKSRNDITKEILKSLPPISIVEQAASSKSRELFHGFCVYSGTAVSTVGLPQLKAYCNTFNIRIKLGHDSASFACGESIHQSCGMFTSRLPLGNGSLM